ALSKANFLNLSSINKKYQNLLFLTTMFIGVYIVLFPAIEAWQCKVIENMDFAFCRVWAEDAGGSRIADGMETSYGPGINNDSCACVSGSPWNVKLEVHPVDSVATCNITLC
ncbi:9763_t:CDS:2, partial [Gigaspora rosea]